MKKKMERIKKWKGDSLWLGSKKHDKMKKENLEQCIIPREIKNSFTWFLDYADKNKFDAQDCLRCNGYNLECIGYVSRKEEIEHWDLMGGFG